MMFSRYSNPYELLRTYKVIDLGGFLLQLVDKREEEFVERMWLSTDMQESLMDFKKQNCSKRYQEPKDINKRKIDSEQEKRNIEVNSQYIKPVNK